MACFYQDEIKFNFSGKAISIETGANELSKRLMNMFVPIKMATDPYMANTIFIKPNILKI